MRTVRLIGEVLAHYSAPTAAIIIAIITFAFSWNAQQISPKSISGVLASIIAIAVSLIVERATSMRKVIERTHLMPEKIDRVLEALKYECEMFTKSVRDVLGLENYIRDAKHEIFLIGPTRYSLVEKHLEERLLERASKVYVKVLIMDKAHINVLANCMQAPHMTDDLQRSHERLLECQEKAVEKARGKQSKFEVRVYPLLPFTLNIIDGMTDRGKMLFIFHRAAPEIRPCFEITHMRQPELFKALYSYYKNIWDKGTPLKPK